MINEIMIVVCILVLVFLVSKFILLIKAKRKQKKQNKPFRVDNNLSKKDRHIHKRLREATDKVSYKIMPVIHFSATGDPFLIPSFTSHESVKYTADKSFTKQRDESKKICVHYHDGKIEEGWVCAEKEPANIKINPRIDKNAVVALERFTNSYMRLERDFLRRSILNMSKEQIRIITLFFISGIGISSIFWVGAIAIFFVV